MIKIIIAGSRNFNSYKFLKKKMDFLLQNVDEEIIIHSGGARGADLLGEQYAKEKDYSLAIYKANWRPNGIYDNTAGYKRNELMAQESTHCVCFWDGHSKGTKHMINLAQQYDLKLRVYRQHKVYALPEFTTNG